VTSMKAHHYAPIAPLDTEPIGPYTEPQQREEALRDALRDVDMGTYDERILRWTIRSLDNSTVRVLVSWLERVRGAGMVEVLDAENALKRHQQNARRFSA
jgi:hypothetical protein